MRAQVFQLCADNYINILFVKPHQKCQADLDRRTILILPVRSSITYAVAMHELGHILDAQAFKTKDPLKCEAYAWRWAEKNACVWNATATKHRDACLRSYLEAQGEFRPPANSIFWKVYKGV